MNAAAQAVLRRRAPAGVSIVDAHAHCGPYSLFFIPDAQPAAMVRVMDRSGVSTAVLSSHLAIQLDAREGNDATAAAVDAFPGRLLGYVVVNPWQDPVAELERRAGDRRFAGIKLHPDLHHYRLTGPRYDGVWEFAARIGCPVLTHTWIGSAHSDLGLLAEVADRHPDVTLLAGHAGGTRPGADAAIEVARRHSNVVLEICGSLNHGADLERMVGELGAHRVVFGSDFPFLDLRCALGRVLFAQLDDAERAAVLGENMQRLLRPASR